MGMTLIYTRQIPYEIWKLKIKSLVNIPDNIIIIVLKYCKDKFILKGEVYESYKFIKGRFC